MARNPVSLPETSTAPGDRGQSRSLVAALLDSLRPDQWLKNLVVFAGLIFGELLWDRAALGAAISAFAVFCALSSAMYLVNDLSDREEDRRHPVKSRRPIAAGELSVGAAGGAAGVLLVGGLAFAFRLTAGFGLICLIYVALVVAYSRFLKHLVILDVLTIAAGFVLRAVGGAVAVSVPISQWLLVCTILLASFLALSKRRHELGLLGTAAASHRQALAHYSSELLDRLITIVAAANVVSYALYTADPATVEKFGTDRLTWTLPFPIYGIFRYLYLVHRHDAGGSPVETLMRDRPLLACVGLWAAAIVLIIYRPVG